MLQRRCASTLGIPAWQAGQIRRFVLLYTPAS